MRILTRYILREVIPYGVIGVTLCTFVIFMRDLERIMEQVVRNSAPLPSIAEVFAYTIPNALPYTLPMGVLIGVLIGLSRLAADSEVTAMRASGLGAQTFVRSVAIFVVIAWGLALLNNVVVAPRAAAALTRLQDRLKASQASFEVQPRVFYENFRNYVLYVNDVSNAERAALWKGVFLADVSNRSAPKITLAREGLVISESPESLRLHLRHGSQHEISPRTTHEYSISHFADTDIQLPTAEPPPARELVPVAQMTTSELLALSRHEEGLKQRVTEIELHRRFALATACLVLAMVGVPLGLSAKRGGKSTGFVLTIVLVFVYYFFSLAGMSFARQGRIPPWLGMWMPNMAFFIGGAILLWRVDRMPMELGSVKVWWSAIRDRLIAGKGFETRPVPFGGALQRAIGGKRKTGARFPLILDDYILKDFLLYLAMILAAFLVLLLVFTFFELLGDIVRNRVPLILIGEYLLNLIPYLIYNLAPMCVLLAVLVTFGLLQKSNEITAMKATGISIYRVILPVLVLAGMLAGSLFLFDQFYLPRANKRQDALRNRIKGKPAQTYLRPDRKWIFGQHATIYYYEFYDTYQNRFGGISAFEFDPATFEITRRVYATRAHWEDTLNKWVFEQGWERSFHGAAIADYRTFEVATFAELNEPPMYFRKEMRQSSEMSFGELRRYINDLQQSGFDVVRLRVQLQKKFAFPIITFVMAVLAVPFSLRAARRGAVTGVAVAISIAVIYWTVSALFEALGNSSQLPAALAAWSPDLLFALAGGYMILKVPT
jgi:LPS export ABC transporter permease LptF/LPS export ABC transporter permease LptG